MSEHMEVEESSGNVFSDLGFDDEEAKEELLKAELGAEIFRILEYRRLTQTKAARIMRVKQPEISRLKSGKFFVLQRRTADAVPRASELPGEHSYRLAGE